jgi:hypothetical protein
VNPDPHRTAQRVCAELRRNFACFLTEARFEVGEDDYFVYARFSARHARSSRTVRRGEKINRGFTVLNKMARTAAQHPRIRQMQPCGPLESSVDASQALARKRLSRFAQGYLQGLCE